MVPGPSGIDMKVDEETQSGTDTVSATPLDSGRIKVSIVTNHAPHILNAHYEFEVE
jgi:hypothetical protein